MGSRVTFRHFVLALVALLSWASPPAGAGAAVAQQQETLELDAGQSTVHFTVDSTLHTVHGTFQLKSGSVHFDPTGGDANGQLVVMADSGNSDNQSRDRKMAREVLEAAKYPEIVFTPQKMKGALALSGPSQFQLEGIMTLHGQPHPMTLDVKAQVEGRVVSADTSFVIPYIQWGLKNPSALFLRVNDKVDIHIHAVGQLKPSTN